MQTHPIASHRGTSLPHKHTQRRTDTSPMQQTNTAQERKRTATTLTWSAAIQGRRDVPHKKPPHQSLPQHFTPPPIRASHTSITILTAKRMLGRGADCNSGGSGGGANQQGQDQTNPAPKQHNKTIDLQYIETNCGGGEGGGRTRDGHGWTNKKRKRAATAFAYACCGCASEDVSSS